jgi:nitrilase
VNTERKVTVAAAQVAPVFLNREACVSRAEQVIAEAATHGARLVVFPEAWLPGFPIWTDAGLRWEDPFSKRAFAQLHRNAVEVPSPATDALCRAARRHRIYVVMGMNERDTRFSHGTLFNSLLYISDQGDILGVHRKLVPTHTERVIWGQGDGSGLHVFDTAIGRLGGLICWENWMPLARFAMHAKGEQIHVAVWPEMPEMYHVASRSYAFEGRCYVITVGTFLPLSAVGDEVEAAEVIRDLAARGTDPSMILSGNSAVVGPDGSWVAEPVHGREAMVYAELDLNRIAEEQLSLDSAGHYNRPDVFRLEVDESPRDQLIRRIDSAGVNTAEGPMTRRPERLRSADSPERAEE